MFPQVILKVWYRPCLLSTRWVVLTLQRRHSSKTDNSIPVSINISRMDITLITTVWLKILNINITGGAGTWYSLWSLYFSFCSSNNTWIFTGWCSGRWFYSWTRRRSYTGCNILQAVLLLLIRMMMLPANHLRNYLFW